ncbi:hypothetical protein [Sphingomonas sp. SCN 67-18]|uniref:hypothetical protein n=1 Tax=uncultured Sphingomonas sp. TaxID=158754 RepID=UPI0025D008A7|nr:hypothetical protein [Sphingomonas sp. SCN 67-18]
MAENWWLIVVVVLVIGIGLWWLVGRSGTQAAPPAERKAEDRPAPPPAALAREPDPVIVPPKAVETPRAPVAAPAAPAAPAARAAPKKAAAPKAAPKTAPVTKAPAAKAPAAKAAPKTAAKAKAAPAAKPAAAPKAAPKPAARAAAKPKAAPKPRVEAPDDLLLLKGVGPKVAALLAAEGVTRFAQIAAWSDADLTAIDDKLGTFKGRPARDKWVEQAGYLAKGDRAGFEAKFGKLEG